MNIIDQSVEIITDLSDYQIYSHIEKCGRVCYKSEDKITDTSYIDFIKNIIKRKHEAVLEHVNISVKIICDRGVSHEIVRHRIASYCQESTRYCNYSKDKFSNSITYIEPVFWQFEKDELKYKIWKQTLQTIEENYLKLIELGASAQEARSILPNSLKTELIMTCNIREWRHFLKLRTSEQAHPQMRQVALSIYTEFMKFIPLLFGDICNER